MTEKSEALRLADAIDPFVRPFAPDHLTSKVAADELRRLHAQRDALLEACKRALRYSENVARAEGVLFDDDNDLPVIEAAIKAAEE